MKFTKLNAADVQHLVVHCSFTPADLDIGVAEIRDWHRERGWLDIGYHLVIRRDGTVELGRPLNAVGAHVYGHNETSIGICLVGGSNDDATEDEDNFTAEQIDAANNVLVMARFMFRNAIVIGHRDLDDKKTCPVVDMARLLGFPEYN